MTGTPSPERWAIDISVVLNTVLGKDRFPVDVALVAKEYSAQRYPNDPVSLVIGRSLPGFDGALYRAPAGKKGWGIFYNNAIASEGRINFTLGHEFGHYLIHRVAYPDGIQCGEQDVVRWDSKYGQIEHQANVFSAGLLMPLDDFRRQIPQRDKVDLDMISHCADRYRVSLIAAVLHWLQYTARRAVLVVSRDGSYCGRGRALRRSRRAPSSGPPGRQLRSRWTPWQAARTGSLTVARASNCRRAFGSLSPCAR
jgi:hypothetical protein